MEAPRYPSPFDSAAFQRFLQILDDARQFLEFTADHGFQDRGEPDDRTDRAAAPGIRGEGFLHTIEQVIHAALSDPESLAEHYAKFARLALKALNGDAQEPEGRDRRFKDEMWRSNPFFRGILQLYTAWSESMQSWLDSRDFTDADRQRVQFLFNQLISALAPANLPIQPAALKRAETTNGRSFVIGIRQWVDDLLNNNGMPRQILPDAYVLGKDLGASPGAVVYRNSQLELIQYQPQADRVYRRPMLLIPPQINKFYVFDLRPSNSMIGYLLRNQIQVFAISWRNPSEADRAWGIDTYIESVLKAMDVVAEIARCSTLNILSACAGGLTAMVLLGYLAEKGRSPIRSHCLFVTELLSKGKSIMDRFATVEAFNQAKDWSRMNGVMEGKDLSKVFCWLRPDDLVWNYWINNYLMGRKPHALDVLYWDNDPTRLPAQLHSDFLDMYAKEVFEVPHALKVLGVSIDFRKPRVDTYFTAGREDYLTPWENVYRAARLFRGRHEFVLSDSGHVQSLLRPPNLTKVEYFTNTHLPPTPGEWLSTATHHPGSWWPHWIEWLQKRSGATKAAPEILGSRRRRPLMAAPGSYVFKRY